MRALLIVALLCSTARAGVLTVGQPAVELDVAVDVAGKPFRLAAFRGRWIVLAIGAAWCGPCQDELPVWNKLAGEVRATFIALALDDDIADGKAFHKRLGVPNLVRAYLPADRSQVAERYGAVKMPVTFVIGPDGVIRHVQFGFEKAHAQREYAELAAVLVKLLPKPKPAPKPAPKPPDPVVTPRVSPALALLVPEAPHTTLWAAHWPRLPF